MCPRLNMRQLVFVTKPQPPPGFFYISFSYDEAFIYALKQWPGCRYAPEAGKTVWAIPKELQKEVLSAAQEFGLSGKPEEPGPRGQFRSMNPKLHDFQKGAINSAFWRPLINFEMGLGKTPTAIEAMRLSGCHSVLIICPASVRLNWQDELRRWWPDGPDSLVIDDGATANEWDPTTVAPIGIVSYELLAEKKASKVPRASFLRRFDAIVVDESHYIANAKSGRSKIVRAVLDANRDTEDRTCLRLMLTATPITNEPSGVWHQLDCLFPRRFGSYWGFVKRYCNKRVNAYSDWDYGGLNPDNADELQNRLAAVSVRVTKKEVAHLLPPFTVQAMRVKAPRGFNAKELLDRFTQMRAHENKALELVRAAGSAKVDAAVEQVQAALDSGVTHVAVHSYFHETAHEIADRLRHDGHTVTEVTGNDEPKVRHEMIAAAKKETSGVLVTSMCAVNVGIDLTFCPVAVVAELSYVPADMIQLMGRHSRLSGKVPSQVILLVLEGTQDELIASRLMHKIQDINAVQRSGQAESGLQSAFDVSSQQTEEDFLAEMRQSISKQSERDEYL